VNAEGGDRLLPVLTASSRPRASPKPPLEYVPAGVLFDGVTGIVVASPPLGCAVSDSHFVVAHFHYVLGVTVMVSMFAGFYFWWPKMTGKMLKIPARQGPVLADVRRL
jgi:hypothetical protein